MIARAPGRNAERSFHQEKRSNETHRSTRHDYRLSLSAELGSEIPAIVLADTGSLKDSSATTKSGLATKRCKCQFAARSACSFDGGVM
jgi:hypothetical protein